MNYITILILTILSIKTTAATINLKPGETTTISNTVITCESTLSPCDDNNKPYIICINKGYNPTMCKPFKDKCSSDAAACLKKGYNPTSCL